MPSFLPELTRRTSGALAVAALVAAAVAPQAQAAAVSGQGTWETTLQGRDLDGSAANGFEAYYDTALGLTWLADASYAFTSGYESDGDGGLSWDDAKVWAAQLNINGVTGWRLPDVKPVNGTIELGYNITSKQSELAHLYYVTLGNKGYYDVSGNYQSDYGLSNTGPFRNVQAGPYWSGVEYAYNVSGVPLDIDSYYAWSFTTNLGRQIRGFRFIEFAAWAVHPGDIAPVPEPQGFALALVSLAVAGVAVSTRYR